MKLLDIVAEWVLWVLVAMFSPATAAFLSIPAIVLVVAVGSTIFVRKLLVPLGRTVAIVLGWAAVLVGALALLPEVAVAAGYRQASLRPPAVVYSFGDMVASAVATFGNGAQTTAAALGKVARINVFVMLLAVGAWIWWWNYSHCPDGAFQLGVCTRPITAWWADITKK